MAENELSTNDGSKTESIETDVDQEDNGDGGFSRKAVAAMLGLGAVAGGAGNAAATHSGDTSTAKKWDRDRDAQGHSLLNLDELWVDELNYDDLDVSRLTDVEHASIENAELGHVYTASREADVVVWKDDSGTYHADGSQPNGASGTVASADDLIDVVQAAVDSLTAGRSVKETVLVAASGTVPEDTSQRRAIDLPSYTVLDVPGQIDVGYSAGSNSGDVLVRATDASHVEIPRLNVSGGPANAIGIESCSYVTIGDVSAQFASDADTGPAIRVDDSGASRSSDVQLESAYVVNGGSHAVSWTGVDRGQVGRVLAKDHAGASVKLDDVTDATVGEIVGNNPNASGSTPTFEATNGSSNVAVGQIVSRSAPRGVSVTSSSHGITFGEVNVSEAGDRGIVLDDTVSNVTFEGGLVKNVTGEAVLSEADTFSLTNLRVVDDRPATERTQTIAIRTTSAARNGRIVNNDVRQGGTDDLIQVASPPDDVKSSTVVRDNVGDGTASGTVELAPAISPAARVEGVSSRKDASLELRARTNAGPTSTFSWDHHFEWDGSQWDLVFEWRTSPAEAAVLDYIVDQPQPNLGP